MENLNPHPYADIFPMIEGDAFEELKKDIKEQGLQQTIILYDGKILDGRNRYKACMELGIEPRFEEYRGDSPLQFVIRLNLKRRHLNESQKAVLALDILPIFEEEAKKRQVLGAVETNNKRKLRDELQKKADNGDKLADWQSYLLTKEIRQKDRQEKREIYFIVADDKIKVGLAIDPEDRLEQIKRSSPNAELIGTIKGGHELERAIHNEFNKWSLGHEWFKYNGEIYREITNILAFSTNGKSEFHTDIQLGKLVNVGKTYINDAKKLKQEKPELLDEIRKGKKTISEVKTEIKKEERHQFIEQQRQDIADGKIKLPEGKYEIIVIDPPWMYGNVDDYTPDSYFGRVANPYPEMTLEEIKNLKIPASDDCVLWLWTTHKYIFECRNILEGWGFRDVSILTWGKNKIGIGHYLRSQTEYCVMAIKGKPIINLTNESTLLIADNQGHSIKPMEFYNMVDKLCIGRKLDYFARDKKDGWDNYGLIKPDAM